MDITWLAAAEEHFPGEALTPVEQRSALAGVAWARVQLFHRALSRDMVRNDTMPFPVRKQDLVDALGLSLVHDNNTRALTGKEIGQLV